MCIFLLECVCVCHCMCTYVGSSPGRRIPLLGITHLVVGKHFQVLEVHQEVDTFEVLVGKKARFWLCYVIRKILDSLSSFYLCKKKIVIIKLILYD